MTGRKSNGFFIFSILKLITLFCIYGVANEAIVKILPLLAMDLLPGKPEVNDAVATDDKSYYVGNYTINESVEKIGLLGFIENV
jgi:hypothetical protein